ncbi:MAG: hypothetical protein WC867_05985, partial [Candidatus Pacearchaeota archaeon]
YDCISPKAPYIRFPYEAVTQVFVNLESIWENRNVWDRIFHGVKLQNFAYAGRGDITLHVNQPKLDLQDFLDLVKHKPLSLELIPNVEYFTSGFLSQS